MIFCIPFFSTICIRLEHGKWGSVYPKLMEELYQGCLKNQDLNEGLEELCKVKKRTEKLFSILCNMGC
ncbi:MAG: Imm70 family immunity protein [Mediterraneibacter faecis]